MKILMVCLGNICRSPLAEGILKTKAQQNGLNWQIDSCGTGNWHEGNLPDSRSVTVAKNHGIDITDQRSRPITRNDLGFFDVIYVMDSSNYQNVIRLCQTDSQKEKVKLIMNECEPQHNIAVPDPYYGNDGFENVYQMLDKACEAIISKHRKI